jgi:hypothetical protein
LRIGKIDEVLRVSKERKVLWAGPVERRDIGQVGVVGSFEPWSTGARALAARAEVAVGVNSDRFSRSIAAPAPGIKRSHETGPPPRRRRPGPSSGADAVTERARQPFGHRPAQARLADLDAGDRAPDYVRREAAAGGFDLG